MERHRERRREMERHIERRREMDRVHTDTSGIPSQTPKMAIRGMVMNGSSAHAWHPSLSLACSLSPLLSGGRSLPGSGAVEISSSSHDRLHEIRLQPAT